ncbi:hypothetical protein M422DRAFT_250902, partial [Sphaerobolus stellatus SS14]
MGFCRRCGEIVPSSAARCKCGGAPVAPSVPWVQSTQAADNKQDKWAKTYVSTPEREKAPESAKAPEPAKLPAAITAPIHTQAPGPEKAPEASEPAKEPTHQLSRSPTKTGRRFPRPLSAIGPSRFTDNR